MHVTSTHEATEDMRHERDETSYSEGVSQKQHGKKN